MLFVETSGDGAIVIFFLHWLSGSGHSWDEVTTLLNPRFECRAIDLPGFGASASLPGYSVDEMAAAVIEVIEARKPASWMLVGHSMGAKVATAVARAAENGRPGLGGLRSMVLLAGSPPSPEPMEESRRAEMLTWFEGDAAQNRAQAAKFIRSNREKAFGEDVEEQAIADVLAMQPAAWRAWLQSGSREDRSAQVGILRTPTMIAAGEEDADLGPDGQRALMLPQFAHAQFRTLGGTRHLLPMESPDQVAALIAQASTFVTPSDVAAPGVPGTYLELMESGRVSSQTRALLMERALGDSDLYQPAVLSPVELAVLRAVADRVVPQDTNPEGQAIDLAARIDQQLSKAKGNGWRYDLLPPDAEAYHRGLKTLNAEAKAAEGVAFLAMKAGEQDTLLSKAASGKLGEGLLRHAVETLGLGDKPDPELFNGEQMRRWFEEVRADLVRLWVAHPATLAAMAYSGIGDGAAAETMQGFVALGVGEREPWEPVAIDGGRQ